MPKYKFTNGKLSSWSLNIYFVAQLIIAVFNYDPNLHNVEAVDRGGYNSCTTLSGAKVFRSGKDKARLGRGQNYFICSFPRH